LVAPKGTRLLIEGRYDNSPNNPFNPDPTAPVRFGDQAKDEMLFPTFGLIIDGSIDVSKVKVIQPSPRAGKDFTVGAETSASK